MSDDDSTGLLSLLTDGQLETLLEFVSNPGKFIRGFIFGSLLAGIGDFLTPIFEAMQLLMLGSQPAEFGAPNETWGIADVPVVIGGVIGDTAASVILLVFETYAAVLRALIPSVGSPLVAPLASVALVVTGVVIFRIIGPTVLTGTQALLEAVPVVGGPLATILGELRS